MKINLDLEENKYENQHETCTVGIPVRHIDDIMAISKEELDKYIDARVGLLLADFLTQKDHVTTGTQ